MEGPLVSDTTELLNGAPSVSEDAPVGISAPPAAAGGSALGDPGADGATASTSKSRSRGGTGLSSLLMPELQRIAQSMGIPGAGRMRKGQLVEAIQARQGGAPRQETGAANQGSDQRVASAGADSTRLRKQDAMEPDTRTQLWHRRRCRGRHRRQRARRDRRGRSRAAAQLRPGGRDRPAERPGSAGPGSAERSPAGPELSRPPLSRPEPRRRAAPRRAPGTTPSRVYGTRPRRARRSAATGGAGTDAVRTSPRAAGIRAASQAAVTRAAVTRAGRDAAAAVTRAAVDQRRPRPGRP